MPTKEQEEREARRWYARNKHKLPPQELPRERVVMPDTEPRQTRRERTRVYSNAEMSVIAGAEGGVVYSEANRYVPIQGTDMQVDLQSAAMSARVEAALQVLPVNQVTLLVRYHLEGRTLR